MRNNDRRDRGRRRVVVTGIGAVSAWGWDVRSLAAGLASGRTAIAPTRRFDHTGHRTTIAAEVPEPPAEVATAHPQWHRLARADRFAVAAAKEAEEWAGESSRGTSAGVYFASSTAGMAEVERFIARLLGMDPSPLHLHDLASHQMNGPGDAVARALGIRGPVLSLSSACSSAGLAIAAALEAIRRGEVDVAFTGGADSLCQLTYAGFNSLRSVDELPTSPFRADRAGLSLGEGGAVMVLESAERARRRGARVLAELAGSGASCDAHHMTAPEPCGRGAAAAIRRALADAGVEPDEVGFVNAHGTGTPLNDVSEAHALRQIFGPRVADLPVTATKASVGHLLGASGAIEAVATVLCLEAGVVHPTAGDGIPDPELGVDLVVGAPRWLAGGAPAVSTSFGFGGANAALVFAPWTAEPALEAPA